MKLSVKCRSGRERERVVGQRPSGRGGKTPHTFSDDERVAAESDGDVVVPAVETSSLEVVESKFALEILVDALCSPSLHRDPNEALLRNALGQRREEVVGRLVLAVTPFDEQPDRLTIARPLSVGIRRQDTLQGELRREVALGPLSPGAATESAAIAKPHREIADTDRLVALPVLVDAPDGGGGNDSDGVVQAEFPESLAKLARAAVSRVGERNALGHTVGDSAPNHVERQLGLGLKADLVGIRASRRRLSSFVHDSGKYSSKSMGKCSVFVVTLRLTPIWQFAILPADPVYCRCTPTE